ncbi:MAG: hypothetical protein V3T48_11575, partial [Vicinamibacterales bacterium]
ARASSRHHRCTADGTAPRGVVREWLRWWRLDGQLRVERGVVGGWGGGIAWRLLRRGIELRPTRGATQIETRGTVVSACEPRD